MDGSNNCPLPESTVFYRLFPASIREGDGVEEDELTCLAVKCTELAKKLTRDHVWHYDAFSLGVWPPRACTATDSTYPPHIYGSLCYRDNVEDEWLVVWLLLEITKQWPHLVISVSDDDGLFLLIEAAHHLPKWLQPGNALNRVFLYRGEVHIIPKPHTPAEIARYPVATPTFHEAIQLVSNPGIPTEAVGGIQEAIQHRISSFPVAMKTNQQRAHCYVPWPVGHVMSCDPTLVSAAVHALCDRGPGDMRAVRSMHHFSPSTHACLMTQVTFTRCLYAKLLHERFSPPPYAGFTRTTPSDRTHKAHHLGMKLTCGLEMVVCGVGGVSERETAGHSEFQHLSSDSRWLKFLTTLKRKDYFQGELEGSQKHQQLMSSAREYFISNISSETQPGEEGEAGEGICRDPVRAAGLRILTSDCGRETDVREKFSSISPPDDDSWLEISPADLDDLMRKAAGYLPQRSGEGEGKGKTEGGEGEREGGEGEGGERDSERVAAMEDMVQGMKAFVKTVSSHEGAELPWTGDSTGRVDFDTDTVFKMLGGVGEGGMSDSGEEGEVGEGETSDSGEESEVGEMREMMEQMDRELKAAGFKSSLGPGTVRGEGEDVTVARNLLSSLAAQPEAAGPTANILHSLGIPILEPD